VLKLETSGRHLTVSPTRTYPVPGDDRLCTHSTVLHIFRAFVGSGFCHVSYRFCHTWLMGHTKRELGKNHKFTECLQAHWALLITCTVPDYASIVLFRHQKILEYLEQNRYQRHKIKHDRSIIITAVLDSGARRRSDRLQRCTFW